MHVLFVQTLFANEILLITPVDCTAPNGPHVGNGENYESYDECISCDCDNGYLNCCQYVYLIITFS